MERLWSTSRGVLAALIILLALNILAWSIIAYSGKKHAGELQTWSHERSRLLSQQSTLEGELGSLREEITSGTEAANTLMSDLGQRETMIADLQAKLDARDAAKQDLESLRLQIASEYHSGEAQKQVLAQDLASYRQRINLARSELSGKTATLAAREREIAASAKRLSLLGEFDDLQAAIEAERQVIEERKAKAQTDLGDYKKRINLAMSALSGRNATLIARERAIAKADDQLALLNGDIDKAEAELEELKRAHLKRQDVDAALASAEGKLGELLGEQTTKLAILGTLAGKIDRQKTAIEATDSQLIERQADLNGAGERLGTLNAEIDQAEQRLSDLQQEVETRRAERDGAETKLADLRQAREDETSAIAELSQKKKELEKISATLVSREKELAEITSRLAESEVAVKQAGVALAEKNEQVDALDKQVEPLEERLASLDAKALYHERRADEARERLATDAQLVTERQEQITALKRNEERVRIMLAGLQARLAEQRQIEVDLNSLRAEAKAALSERDQQVQLLAEERERVEDVEAQLAEKEAALVSSNQEQAKRLGLLGSLNAKLELQRGLLDEAALAETRLAALTADIDATTANLDERQEALAKAETRFKSLASDIERAEASLAKLETDRQSVEDAFALRQSEVVALQESLEALEEKQAAKREEIAEAEKQLEQVQAEASDVRDAETKMASLASALSKSDADLKARQEAVQSAEMRLATLEAEIAGLTETVDEREKALNSAEQGMDALREAKAKSETDLQQSRAEFEASRSALEKTREANAEAAAKSGILEAALAALDAEINVKLAEKETATLAFRSLQAEVEKAEADLKAQQTSLADGRDELDRLVAERRRLDDAIEDTILDIGSLKTSEGVDPLLAALPVPTENGVRIAHLLFNSSSSKLSPGARRKIEEAAKWIKDSEIQKVRLVGYADAIGSSADNKILSKARADQAAQSLTELGIDPEIIEIEAVGDDVLVEATGDWIAEPLNRSVGIFVDE